MKTYVDLVGNYSRDSSARVDLVSDTSQENHNVWNGNSCGFGEWLFKRFIQRLEMETTVCGFGEWLRLGGIFSNVQWVLLLV
jgi:hypothetical protein